MLTNFEDAGNFEELIDLFNCRQVFLGSRHYDSKFSQKFSMLFYFISFQVLIKTYLPTEICIILQMKVISVNPRIIPIFSYSL